MAVFNAGLPRRRIARLEHDLAAIFAQNDLALEDVNELILLLVPVTLRGGRAGLQRADIDAEMRKPGRACEPLARAPFHRLVERRRGGGRGARRGVCGGLSAAP